MGCPDRLGVPEDGGRERGDEEIESETHHDTEVSLGASISMTTQTVRTSGQTIPCCSKKIPSMQRTSCRTAATLPQRRMSPVPAANPTLCPDLQRNSVDRIRISAF